MIFQACGMNEAVVSDAAINPILSIQSIFYKTLVNDDFLTMVAKSVARRDMGLTTIIVNNLLISILKAHSSWLV